MSESIDTKDVLLKLGFRLLPHPLVGECVAFEFGNLQLIAARMANQYLRETYQFSGIAYRSNSISQVDFQIPLKVDSFEQGVAWLVYGVGTDFKPKIAPEWWRMGLGFQDYLPWRIEAARFASRPTCNVDRDWCRTLLNQLRGLSDGAPEGERAKITFDGEILRVRARGRLLAVPASGTPWPVEVFLDLALTEGLPKRLMTPCVEISVWEGFLRVCRRAIRLGEGAIENIDAVAPPSAASS